MINSCADNERDTILEVYTDMLYMLLFFLLSRFIFAGAVQQQCNEYVVFYIFENILLHCKMVTFIELDSLFPNILTSTNFNHRIVPY